MGLVLEFQFAKSDTNIYTRRGVGEASQVMTESFGISSQCGILNTLSLRWDFSTCVWDYIFKSDPIADGPIGPTILLG